MGKFQATGAHKIHSFFSASGGVLSFYRDNASTQLAFGEDGTGLDVKFFGDTASAFVLWDESADTFIGASSAVLQWGGSASFAGVVDFSGSIGVKGALTVSAGATFQGAVTLSGADLAVNSASIKLGNASTDRIGFYGATATTQQLKAGNGNWASVDNVVGALVKLGLFDVS